MKLIFIVVAAGAGKRFGGEKNKLFYEIDSKPVIVWTLENVSNCKMVSDIVVVARRKEIPVFNKILENYNIPKVKAIIEGGKLRQDSVYKGLLWIYRNYKKNGLFVGIHDGARMNIDSDLITKVYKTAIKYNAAIPTIFSTDTVKKIRTNNFVEQTLPRENITFAQTPQIFKFSLIFNLYKQAYKEKYYATDDSAIVEHYGKKVKVVEGSPKNIKITYRHDLDKSFRVGIGFDIHKFKRNRKLFLGGIQIPFKKGLAGHSDGDVLIHSIIDALLGATGMPDIGELFPDTDIQYKDIRSTELLKKTITLLTKKGVIIKNIDSVVIADQPKISLYKEKMIEELSKIIGGNKSRINIKGKRPEGILFKNGIAAYTVALIQL